jgi:hypothetical protein
MEENTKENSLITNSTVKVPLKEMMASSILVIGSTVHLTSVKSHTMTVLTTLELLLEASSSKARDPCLPTCKSRHRTSNYLLKDNGRMMLHHKPKSTMITKPFSTMAPYLIGRFQVTESVSTSMEPTKVKKKKLTRFFLQQKMP